jgi:hypothetical protein
MSETTAKNRSISSFARIGLLSKGSVYVLLGIVTLMAVFHIGGESKSHADRTGVFNMIFRQTGGQLLLGVIALGLICYSLWRGMMAFGDTEHKGKEIKGLAVRGRYLASGLFYASIAVSAGRILFSGRHDSEDSQQHIAQQLLSKPAGQWLAGVAAAVLLTNGIYQIYYGLSGKYQKHVEELNGDGRRILLLAGKLGYVARGGVWMLLSWLFFRAAIHRNASEAGDTSKAFSFLSQESYGTAILVAIAIGLICYGVFNFIRARYEDFS